VATKVTIKERAPLVLWVGSSGSVRLIWDGADAVFVTRDQLRRVTQVFGSCATSKSFREIMADCFPEDEIRACLEFARDLVQNEDIHVVEEV
jgi:hypothetical protein